MTIVKPSSKKQKSSSNKKLMRSNDCYDVFSDIHVMKKKEIENESDFSYDEMEEEESQEPK